MRWLAQRKLALGWVSLAGLLAGCQAIHETGYRIDPGVTGYSTILGCVAQRFVYPEPLVERALSEAMTDMGMHSVRRHVKHDGALIMLVGAMYDGRAICAELEPQGNQTGVRIRMDVYGDEPLSNVLLQRTSVRLATLPQSVNPPYDPRALSDSALHRGMDIKGYRGAPLR